MRHTPVFKAVVSTGIISRHDSSQRLADRLTCEHGSEDVHFSLIVVRPQTTVKSWY